MKVYTLFMAKNLHDQFSSLLKKAEQDTLAKHIENITNTGNLSICNDVLANQVATNVSCEKTELFLVKINNSRIKPGTLLLPIDNEQTIKDRAVANLSNGGLYSYATCNDKYSVYVTHPDKVGLWQMMTYDIVFNKRFLLLGEYFKVSKHVKINSMDDGKKVTSYSNTQYAVSHLIHLLEGNEKKFVSTKLFCEHDSVNEEEIECAVFPTEETCFIAMKLSGTKSGRNIKKEV